MLLRYFLNNFERAHYYYYYYYFSSISYFVNLPGTPCLCPHVLTFDGEKIAQFAEKI
jgi:hypothetical protein